MNEEALDSVERREFAIVDSPHAAKGEVAVEYVPVCADDIRGEYDGSNCFENERARHCELVAVFRTSCEREKVVPLGLVKPQSVRYGKQGCV